MIVSLSIIRYRPLFIPFALLAMAIHRIPLALNRNCSFWKLMGCGKKGTFDLQPDWQQWALLAVWNSGEEFEKFDKHSFISKYWKAFSKERWTLLSVPLASHGKWDEQEPFKLASYDTDYTGPVAVLTRATIRLNKLRNFWSNVQPVAGTMGKASGFITSVGIGEAPFFRQATFSVWDTMESMKTFAYNSAEHAEVIRKTREENWYSEELFARFRPVSSSGTLNGIDPLESIKHKQQEIINQPIQL